MKKRNQQGFTLIELIIVIVILGILAVTASPKFLDLKGDAVGGSLDGVATALVGGANIEYSRSLISGGGTGTYPANTSTAINAVADLTDWVVAQDNAVDASSTEVRIFQSGTSTGIAAGVFTDGTAPDCYVTYTGGGSETKPTISTVTSGC